MLPLVVFFMTTKEKQQCHPSCFIWWKRQCYPLFYSIHFDPLCFFPWLMKNNSVTPYILLCYPLCFFSWRPIKNNSVTPCGFFHDDQRKTTVLRPMFFFMTTNKKQQNDVFAGIRTWAVWSVNLQTYHCTIKTQNNDNTMVLLDFIIRMK